MIPNYSARGGDASNGGACQSMPPLQPPTTTLPPRLHDNPSQPDMPTPSSPPTPINTGCLPEGMSSEDAAAICDFDRLVRHQDFAKILSSAARLKNLQSQQQGSSVDADAGTDAPNPTANKTPGIMNLALSDLHSNKAATIVRENTCANSSTSSSSSPPSILPRGLFPYTDALVDETIDSLVAEFDRCLSIVQGTNAVNGNNADDDGVAPSTKKARKKPPKGKKKVGGNASQSIAVKYSKEQTDILTDWMIQNRSHPFPDQNQIQALSEAAGLTYSQVVNWTTNVRKRNLKATVEHGKKPHHFLDFLFLADDREKKQLGGEPLKTLHSTASLGGATKKGRGKNATTSTTRRQANSTKSRGKARTKTTSQTSSRLQNRYESDLMSVNEEEMPPLEATVAVPPPLVPSAPFFQHPNMMPPSNSLPPPLPGKVVLPYPPMPYHRGGAPQFHHGAYHPPYCPPPGHPHPHPQSHFAAAGGNGCDMPPPPGYPHPRKPPSAACAEPLPMDTGGNNTLAGSISPPYQQTEVSGTYDVQATITPSSSASPTEGRRDTGDSLEEALNFWGDGGLFSSEDIRNDAVLRGPAEDMERVAIQKATEGGLISTPPPRVDEDEETNGSWGDGYGEGDILKSFEDNGSSSVPVLPYGGSLKRSSISDAAMLPKARNERARRLSSLGTTLQSLGYNPEIFTSAFAGSHHQQQKLQMDDPPDKRLSDASLPNDFFTETITNDLAHPLDEDGFVREFLEENGAVQI